MPPCLPPAHPAPKQAIAGYAQTPLGAITQAALPADGRSGFRLQPYGPNAFATRLELARLATRSLDVQYYLLQGDNAGRSLMRALRDAAARGVRVRVLVDDLYTAGEDELLLGLAAYPGVEVRLFNPFPGGRAGELTRFIASGLDFGRVNRRMHNKLFVADNAAAVPGGRNMADEYVSNTLGRNFMLGPLLPAGARVLFDPLTKTEGWNERQDSISGTVTAGVIDWFRSARISIKMVSPYFVPNDKAVASLAGARAAGLEVELVTNSLASTDEPVVYFGYWPHVEALLKAGVEIRELSPSLSAKRHRLGLLGRRTGALHMKNAIVDHR